MKPHPFRSKLLATGFLVALCASPLQAESSYSIKKIDPLLTESPQITAGNYRKQQPAGGRAVPWLEVDVTFEHDEGREGPKVSDDVTAHFYILLNNAALTPDRQATLLTGSVTLTDIPVGKALHAGAFVSPQTLARFFDGKVPPSINQAVTDVGVTLSGPAGLATLGSFKGTVDLKQGKGWWDAETGMTKVPGRVLDKSQTPFSALSWDYYQPPKTKAGN
jgi:hypothetical protein